MKTQYLQYMMPEKKERLKYRAEFEFAGLQPTLIKVKNTPFDNIEMPHKEEN